MLAAQAAAPWAFSLLLHQLQEGMRPRGLGGVVKEQQDLDREVHGLARRLLGRREEGW